MKRNIYLDMVSEDQALEKYLNNIEVKTESERIPISQGLHRKTAQAVYANISNPSYNSSAMDGVAVNSKDTVGASPKNPVKLETGAFEYINTGDPLPNECDAVIMIENIEEVDGGILIRDSVPVYNDIRTAGEDIVAGEMILPSNHILRPVDISILVAGGVREIEVYKEPLVSIIPTGSEIIEEGQKPKKGQILDSNSWMIRGTLEEIGARVKVHQIIHDDLDSLISTCKVALEESQMILLIAGSSAGSKDYSKAVIESLGQVDVHGVSIKPGKPTILARSKEENKPIIALPGYPVSCWLALENFVMPSLAKAYPGIEVKDDRYVEAVSGRRIISSLKYKEYVRIKLGKVKDKLIASPLDRGAGSTMSLVRADGFAIIPQGSEGVEAGKNVNVQLLRPIKEIEESLMVSGSHDLIIDEIADEMRKNKSPFTLSSSHLGSLGGLLALERGETHIAPSHLLDEKTGKYNDSYIEEIFSKGKMAVISGVGRIQGLMTKKSNPLNIKSIEDIKGKKFINRQRGSGTRIFTDYLLKENNISPDQINGYDIEKTSHMDIAASVKEGADVGIGVYSAAKALDLEFIELGKEAYEFVVYKEDLENPMVKEFIEILKSPAFKERVERLGGYDLSESGNIRFI